MSLRAAQLLNLQRLSTFVTICEEGSLTRASARLGIAQPALSNTIRKLESDLGVSLLTRHPRGSFPTAAGVSLLRHAYELLGLADATLDDVCEAAREPEGEIAIGLPAATSIVLAIPLIRHLSVRLPKVSLRVVEAFSGYLWDWLRDGALDIAICFDRTSTPEVICHPLCREELYLVGRSDLLSDAPREISRQRLSKLPLILPSKMHGIRAKVERHAKQEGGLNVRMEIDAGTHLVKLIAGGEGFGVLAKCAVGEDLAAGRVKALPLKPRLSRGIQIGVRRLKARHQLTARVEAELRMVALDLMEQGIWPADPLQAKQDLS